MVKRISHFPTSAVVCRVETESLEVDGEGPMASGELDAFSGPVHRYFLNNAVNRSASLTIIPLLQQGGTFYKFTLSVTIYSKTWLTKFVLTETQVVRYAFKIANP
ncbi:hypothetical protein AVEN_225748-1 [Araneus ventricosus]|uniref:Uncharacterized protein n=1 Tax=Araneus ventricosus TaxID=182803 RepID=A0A4Y2FU00_ARAVE|nr:hypothetical protein AVEN_225748-1 [Araneus ventricosus]